MKAKLVKYPYSEKKYRWDTWYQGKEFEYFWDESLPNNFETIEPYLEVENYTYKAEDEDLYALPPTVNYKTKINNYFNSANYEKDTFSLLQSKANYIEYQDTEELWQTTRYGTYNAKWVPPADGKLYADGTYDIFTDGVPRRLSAGISKNFFYCHLILEEPAYLDSRITSKVSWNYKENKLGGTRPD